MEKELGAAEDAGPVCDAGGGGDYALSASGLSKILQVVLGIIVCCTAGIYCLRGGQCTSNPAQVPTLDRLSKDGTEERD